MAPAELRQVPQRQRPGGVGGGRERRHVVHRPGAVVHVREHQDGDVAIERDGQGRGLDRTHLHGVGEQATQALRDVQIGREVVGLREDHAAPAGEIERRRQELEEVDGRGVGDDHLARLCADQARDPIAHSAWPPDPVVAVPAPDEVAAPVLHDTRDTRGRGGRERTQRVAVEVDHAGW